MDECPSAMSASARILIVDADGRVRRALRALIETQLDMAVIGEADSAAAALRGARALRPTVIVLDLMLPTGQMGLATLRKLTRRRQTCIATSWEGGLRTVSLELGAKDFLEKGAPPALLLAVIRRAMMVDETVPDQRRTPA